MATNIKTTQDGEVVALAGRLAEMSHLTTLTTLDALLGAATAEGELVETAKLARRLADRIARSTSDFQETLALE